MNKLGQNIKKIRELNNFTQKYMASMLNMTQGNYARIESGEINISEARLNKIAEALNCKPGDIISLDTKQLFSQRGTGMNMESLSENEDKSVISYKISPELKQLYEERIDYLKNYIEELKAEIKKLQGQSI
ncbi:MAG TPA: helix-turn-helix transcriptional regulator [Edaphocola sp.]|nr:helix-turn-helix transcriptional regulator [Edaphocola sp.]